MATLSRLAGKPETPTIVLTTVNAALQRVPSREFVARGLAIGCGGQPDPDGRPRPLARGQRLSQKLDGARAGRIRGARRHSRSLRRRDRGEPVRLDFFGDTLESIRTFDPETQRTVAQRESGIDLVPASEMMLTPETIARFRERYIAMFGAADRDDLLYQSVSEGRRHVGMEHWLALFSDSLDTLFDHLHGAPVILDHMVDEVVRERLDLIADHYEARRAALDTGGGGGVPYKPVPPDWLYLTSDEWKERLGEQPAIRLSPFAAPGATT